MLNFPYDLISRSIKKQKRFAWMVRLILPISSKQVTK